MPLNYIDLLEKHIDSLEKVLIAFSLKSSDAIDLLNKAKDDLNKNIAPQDKWGEEYYFPAVYNALATIKSAIEQEKINPQLTQAVVDAKEELIMISSALKEL